MIHYLADDYFRSILRTVFKKEEISNSEDNVVSDKQRPMKKDFHEATGNDFRIVSSVTKAQKNFVYLTTDLDELSRKSDLCQSESVQSAHINYLKNQRY